MNQWFKTATDVPTAQACGPILMRDQDDPGSFCIATYYAGRWEYWSNGDPIADEDLYGLWMPIPPIGETP